MRRPALGALLVLVWVLLWDRLTVGQVLAGMVVAAALLAVLRPPASRAGALSRPRAAALVRLFVWFAGQFAVSNLQVARAALWPGRYVRPGVVRVPLHTRSGELIAFIANATALSPGMQPIGTHDEPPWIDVHVLTLRTPEEAIAFVHRLEGLLLAAFPSAAGDDHTMREARR
ncbi:MAG: Na+/H+ antiporter subunit E [Acidimicrobiia bacterium]